MIFPSPAGMSLTKLPNSDWRSLVSDIPAGDGKIGNLFYSVSDKFQKGGPPTPLAAAHKAFLQTAGSYWLAACNAPLI